MRKGIRSIKYSLDKDLKDLGGIWSRIDFRTFISNNLIITPGRIRMFNNWFQAGCLLQRPAKGIRRKKKTLRVSGNGRIPIVIYEPEGLKESASCLVYYHGGAFVLRDRPATHRLAQVYAEAVGCRVVLV